MNLSQVKLVVTDMDGTLLNSKGKVSENFLLLFDQLKKHNVHFVAASGRQYHSISTKLETIKNEITIIAENGGFTKQGEKELLITSFEPEKVSTLIPLLRKINGTFTVLCGKNAAYIETENERFINMFSEYYSEYEIVDDLTKVSGDDFFKIAVYHFESSEDFIYPIVKHFESEMQVKVSGQNWLDLSHNNANKGFALHMLQTKMGITKEETMVFGDYNNDLEMLELAHFSYAMENAHPNVKKIARFQTKSNNEEGVEFILKQLLLAKI